MKLFLRPILLFLLLASSTACSNTRILRLENRILQAENEKLEAEALSLRENQVDQSQYSPVTDIQIIKTVLEKGGYTPEISPDKSFLKVNHIGKNTAFGVNLQYFDKAKVIFIATSKYFSVDLAQSTSSVVLLAIQLVTLNYDILLGKFQMNPETGEILLSTEMYVESGLDHTTLLHALENLCRTADEKYSDLQRAAAGVGL
jgi:hypothetical protein